MFGVPAIAFSLVDNDWVHLEDAARVAARNRRALSRAPAAGGIRCSNVNIPNLPYEQLSELARHAPGQAASFAAGDHARPIRAAIPSTGSARSGDARDASEGTDFHAVANGYVSITPLQLDLTHTQMLQAETTDWARAGSGAS